VKGAVVTRRRRLLWVLGLVGALLAGWSILRVHCDGVSAPNCGVSSVSDLAYLLGHPVPEATRQEVGRAYASPEISLLQVREIAGRVALDLIGVRGTLDDLAAGGHCPAIIHLRDPDHFVVLARLSGEWVQVLDRGGPLVYAKQKVEERYTGHALVLKEPRGTSGGPRLELPVFSFDSGVAATGQQVERKFVCTNRGDHDLLLRAHVAPG